MWGPLLEAIADDKRLSNGLAAFANWCTAQGISPTEVDDGAVERFLTWLEAKTLYPKPRDLVRRVPNVWNEASAKFTSWPATKLTTLSFRAPSKHLKWSDLSPSFRQDADAYLTLRANPDLFDERPEAPKRPLAATTLRQQSEHLRLAASILVQNGEEIASLADLVRPERFKTILRYYHDQAKGEPNAFVVALAATLVQVAQYHVGATSEEVGELKRLAGKLPTVPFDLTAKNKTLLRQLESERLRAKLLFLPEQLMAKVAKDLERGRVRFVDAQVAIAIDILLAIPLRPQNLSSLHWQKHFSEPNGSRGRLLLHIAAGDTKTKRQEIIAEVPDDVARRLRWYRRHVLPRLGADVEWLSLRHRERQQEGPGDAYPPNHPNHRAGYRHPHDAAPVSAFRCDILPRGPSGGLRDSEIDPRARLEQDHPHLCRLLKPASQPCLQRVPVQAARGAQADASSQEAGAVRHMRTLKHLPVDEWPEADREAFKAAYAPGDVFDETAGPGAHLAEGHAPDD